MNLESVWQVLLPGCNVLAYLGTPTVITGPYKRETKEDLTQEERRPVTMETQTRVMQPQAREHLGQEAWRGRKDPLNGPSKALALPTSSPWPPGLQGCDRRHLCCLKPPVYNPLLQQPHGTPMAGSMSWASSSPSQPLTWSVGYAGLSSCAFPAFPAGLHRLHPVPWELSLFSGDF